MRRAAFNLIEVTLAMLVIALGVVAIFGLVPYGAKAHRDAIHNNRSADAASDILSYIAVKVREDWVAGCANLGETPPDISDATNFPGDMNPARWQPVTGNFLANIFTHSSSPAVFRIQDTAVMPAVAGGRVVTDFDAIIRVWKSKSNAWQYTAGAFSDTMDESYEKRIILNAEVSWPAAPAANDPVNGYNHRRKARYALEISR